MDHTLPGSSVPGILQARTLEWVAISFSNAWKWKVKVKSLGRVRLIAIPWTAAYQAPPFMGFSRQEYWSGLRHFIIWATREALLEIGYWHMFSSLERKKIGNFGLQSFWFKSKIFYVQIILCLDSSKFTH